MDQALVQTGLRAGGTVGLLVGVGLIIGGGTGLGGVGAIVVIASIVGFMIALGLHLGDSEEDSEATTG